MSRRTVFTAVIALSAFGLTAGLTASLGVATDQLGADTQTVSACDGAIDVSYGVTVGQTTVASVTLDNVENACSGQAVTVGLLDAGGTVRDTAQEPNLVLDATDGTGGATINFAAGTMDAELVSGVTVVITGTATP